MARVEESAARRRKLPVLVRIATGLIIALLIAAAAPRWTLIRLASQPIPAPVTMTSTISARRLIASSRCLSLRPAAGFWTATAG